MGEEGLFCCGELLFFPVLQLAPSARALCQKRKKEKKKDALKNMLVHSFFFLPYPPNISRGRKGERECVKDFATTNNSLWNRCGVKEWEWELRVKHECDWRGRWTNRGRAGEKIWHRKGWADASRARIKLVFELLRGSFRFIVSFNELFMFLCILHTIWWSLSASFLASWWICSFYPAIRHCM